MGNESSRNSHAMFVCNGASNHSDGERQVDDYYATEPKATELLLGVEKFSNHIWECACGGGHIAEVLKNHGYNVFNTDIVDRGYENTCVMDFLKCNLTNTMDIVTNPPYKLAKEFVEHAMNISDDGVKVAMFLKLTFLESQSRRKLFEKYPPKTLYVSSNRLQCAKNGDFEKSKSTNAVAYGWYVWEKGFKGSPKIKWI